MVQRAMLAEEDRRRAARKNFRMLTVPVCSQASCEPALLHTNADDHEDGTNFRSFGHYDRCKINQSVNLFVQKCNRHWTGQQGRMQPPLTGARKRMLVKATNDDT